MIKNKKVAVVIPAFNVEKQIENAIKEIDDWIDHIVVVDDCSRDNTQAVIKHIKDERIKLKTNSKNLGVGGASIVGIKEALDLSADIIVKYDGDGQMDPKEMHKIVEPLFNGYDYAKGNRFMHTEELTRMPKVRLIGNFFLTFFTKLASGYWNIFDPQNGYIAIKEIWLCYYLLKMFIKDTFLKMIY